MPTPDVATTRALHFRLVGVGYAHDQPTQASLGGCGSTGVPGGARDLELPATIRIATFNIQNFGKKKLQNAPVVEKLVEIICQYDLVAVQEVSDIDGKVPVEFLKRINATGRRYLLALSERTGKQPDDRNAQEQYAFYYDDGKIEKVDDRLFDDSEHDLFQREPYVARFRARGGRFTFVLITIHTQPKAALAGIKGNGVMGVPVSAARRQQEQSVASNHLRETVLSANP